LKGSILIPLLFIMAALSVLPGMVSSVVDNHFAISRAEDLHQEAYYLAESGARCAARDFTQIIREVQAECLSDFEWDPLMHSLSSLQESADRHVAEELIPKLKGRLKEMGYGDSVVDYTGPVLSDLPPESDIDVKIICRFRNQPPEMRIVSRAKIGKIKRRVDATLQINKVSQLYDSSLFCMTLLSDEGMEVCGSGSFQSDGEVYTQGEILAEGQSRLELRNHLFTRQDIIIREESSASFSQDLVCGSIITAGKGNQVICRKDVYAYHPIEALQNSIAIKGNLHTPRQSNFLAGAATGDILYKMEKQAGWDYRTQLDPSVLVPKVNVLPNETGFSVRNPDSPVLCVIPEEKDIVLPPGEYSGIVCTNGSIQVGPGDSVRFRGLLISGKKVVVEGNLSLKEDKRLLLHLLEEQGEPLKRFFRVDDKKALVEISSFREHLYREIIEE